MDPEISGFENIIIRGLFLGQTRKQMLAKVDEIAEFTELGEYLSMPLRTYSTGMRVRLAMGVVTSIDPEILLLDEGIGAVDADFLKKAQTRLQGLVERSGILVFASHSNEFLARLCKTAMWIDHGKVKMTGGIEEVVRAYEGEDAARHVREVLEETRRCPCRMTDSVYAGAGHPSASRRAGQVAGRVDRPDPRARPPGGRRQRQRRRVPIWLPPNRFQAPISDRAETSVAQAVSRWACCTRWRWAPTGCGWPMTTDGLRIPRCWRPCWRARRSTGSPRCRRWCATWTTPSDWRSRCAAVWCGGAGSANCAPGPRGPVAGIASLFNGALFRASTLDAIGVPDLRLFVRGDETELHRELVRSGLPFGTCLDAVYLHPQGSDEFKPILGGRMHTQYPDDATKRFFVPQPWLPAVAARAAQAAAPGVAAVRLVLPGLAPRSRRPA